MIDISKRLSASVTIFHAAYRGQSPQTATMPTVRCVERMLSLGMGIEVWLSERLKAYGQEQREALRELLAQVDPISTHSGLSSWDPDKLREEISLSASLGASVMVVHLGTLAFEDPEPPTAGIAEVAAFARDQGLTLALENSGRKSIEVLRKALPLVGDDPRSSGLGLCIDTGHANRSCSRDGITPAAFLEELREAIVEVHVNDNEGSADLHLPPGEGNIDWLAVLAAIRGLRDGSVVCLEITAPADPVVALEQARAFVLSQ